MVKLKYEYHDRDPTQLFQYFKLLHSGVFGRFFMGVLLCEAMTNF